LECIAILRPQAKGAALFAQRHNASLALKQSPNLSPRGRKRPRQQEIWDMPAC
jgi:hypothetical protein